MFHIYMVDTQRMSVSQRGGFEFQLIQHLHQRTGKFQRSFKTKERGLEFLGVATWGKANKWPIQASLRSQLMQIPWYHLQDHQFSSCLQLLTFVLLDRWGGKDTFCLRKSMSCFQAKRERTESFLVSAYCLQLNNSSYFGVAYFRSPTLLFSNWIFFNVLSFNSF